MNSPTCGGVTEQSDFQLRAHQFHGFEAGPRLIVTGAVHGNEVCGTKAIHQVLKELDTGLLTIKTGRVTFVPVTNPLAYENGTRAGDRNLNRNLRPQIDPKDFEDRLANALCPLLAEHDVLLDLHSFQGDGEPFALIGSEGSEGRPEPFELSAPEERLVAHLGPQRIVEGWMSVYQLGTHRRRSQNREVAAHLVDDAYGVGTTEYMRSQGGYAVTLECGQHEDPEAPARGVYAIKQTLALLGLIEATPEPPRTDHKILRLVDVIDRESEGDRFSRPWKSFDPVKATDLIGIRADGTEVKAPQDGFVVFPNQKAGVHHEWFYFAQPSQRRFS